MCGMLTHPIKSVMLMLSVLEEKKNGGIATPRHYFLCAKTGESTHRHLW